MKTLNIKLTFMLFILACIVGSCSEFKDSNDYSTDEPAKQLNGSWHITQVKRNGLDITSAMDFSAFRITFDGNQGYKIDNYLPFLVKKNGTWSIDDPQYPTQLTFVEEGSQVSNKSAFEYTIVKGERQLTLSFAPGCPSNIYTYVLERVSNN